MKSKNELFSVNYVQPSYKAKHRTKTKTKYEVGSRQIAC